MAQTITGLDPTTNPTRSEYDIAIENNVLPSEDTKRFSLDLMFGDGASIINSESDLPATSGGFHQCENDRTYVFTSAFTCVDPIKAGVRNTFLGWGTRTSVVTYNGTGTFITVTSTSLSVQMMSFDTPNAETFNCDATVNPAGNPQLLTLIDVIVLRCSKIGTLNNIGLNSNSVTALAADDGWTLVNFVFVFSIRAFAIFGIGASGTALNLATSTVNRLFMDDGFITGSGTGISGLANSANVSAGKIVAIGLVDFEGITTPLSGVARDDIRFIFQACPGILNSVRTAEIDVTTTTPVIIVTPTVFVQINGTGWSETTAQSFSTTNAGIITNTGEVDRHFCISGSATIEKVGGGSDQLEMRIAVDSGSGFVDFERTKGVTDNTTAAEVSCEGNFVLSEGDRIALYVANNDGASNIDVLNARLIVNPIT